jgi:tight adherence protein B
MSEWLLLPGWYDLLTGLRLLALLPFLIAWGAVGWMAGPWIEARFMETTSGYVSWMVQTADKMFMEISGRQVVVGMFLGMMLGVGAAFLLTAGLAWTTPYHLLRGLLVMIFVLAGYRVPRWIMQWVWNRRVNTFSDQMLDALTFMSNGLKSGLSLVQCMDMVREELPNPVSQEFGLVMSEQRLGVPLEDALINLEERIGTEDLQIMVTSINILRQSGGNLSETFDTISFTIQERRKVQGRIKTLTAQGISQGVIIVILPFVLGAVLYVMDGELIERLWTTGLGWAMLAVMLFLQILGAFLIKRIVTIEV